MNIFVCVKTGQSFGRCAFCPLNLLVSGDGIRGGINVYQDVHFVEHSIGRKKLMSDSHSLWFHGMAETIGESSDIS